MPRAAADAPPRSSAPDARPLVLFVLPFRRWGGPGSMLTIFLRHLTRYRALVAVPPDTEGQAALRGTGATVVEVPGLATVPRPTSPGRAARLTAEQVQGVGQLVRLIRRTRPDIVHGFSEGLLQAGIAARLVGRPSVTQAIGMTIFSPPAVGLLTTRLLARLSDLILCAQPMIQGEFTRFGAPLARLQLLHNCIEPADVRRQAADVGPASGPPLLTLVAGMDRRKGHDLLLRAAGRLRDRGIACRVRIVGSVEDDLGFFGELLRLRSELRLGELVDFAGPSDCVPRHLAEGTVHVVPSRIEALPLAGLEAMALGRPVVATRVGGNPYLVVEEETGLLAEAGDPQSLAAQLARVLTDPALARRLGAQGQARVEELFAADRVLPELELAYDRLLGRSPEQGHQDG